MDKIAQKRTSLLAYSVQVVYSISYWYLCKPKSETVFSVCTAGLNACWETIIIIITRTMFMVLSSWLRVIARVHPAHVMNAEQCQMAADLWTKLIDLSHKPTCRLLGNYIHHRRLLLLSSKVDTHFTIPQRVEVPTRFTCPQAISSNRAQCRLTTLIEANTLTSTVHRHPLQCHWWMAATMYLVFIWKRLFGLHQIWRCPSSSVVNLG